MVVLLLECQTLLLHQLSFVIWILVFSTTLLALYNKYQEYEVNAEQIVLRLVAKVDMLEEENKVLKQKLNERQPQLPIEDAPNYNLKTVFQYPWDAPRKRRMSGSKLLRLDTNTMVLIAVVAFGLSMDYEVFLLSRIKEEHDAGNSNIDSVAMGLQKSARIITAAAFILAVVFAAFVISGVTSIKMMGFGVAFAILLDATLIRAFLVPALRITACSQVIA